VTGERPAGFDIIEERVAAGQHKFDIVRPRSAEDLIDEDEYAVDERLPYWAELWPSGRALAAALATRAVAGLRVVELGAGLAIPSFVAAAGGASVIATDWYEPAIDFIRFNARRLGLRLETLLVDWRDPGPELLAAAPFDLVIAADVLYEPRNVDPLCALLEQLTGPDGEVLLADPRRPDAATFLAAMGSAGWTIRTHEVAVEERPDEAGPIVEMHRLVPPGD
jgi:predicted nicotinamide N-methyase